MSTSQEHSSKSGTPTERLRALGIALPKPWALAAGERPWTLASGVQVYAEFVRVVGRRVTISGHLPLGEQGTVVGPFGRVGAEVTREEAEAAARRCALAVLSTLAHELGSLDRIGAWVRVYGLVNAAPDFHDHPAVVNAASRLIYEVFGDDVGRHSRIAIGVAGLPLNVPVEIEGELELL